METSLKQRWQYDPADDDYKLMTVTLSQPLMLGDITTKFQERCQRIRSAFPFSVIKERNGQLAFQFS